MIVSIAPGVRGSTLQVKFKLVGKLSSLQQLQQCSCPFLQLRFECVQNKMRGFFHIHSATCVFQNISVCQRRGQELRICMVYFNCIFMQSTDILGRNVLISYNLIYYYFAGLSTIILNSCSTCCTVDCASPLLNNVLLCSVLPKFTTKPVSLFTNL